MNLYLLKQSENINYDTYDSMIVAEISAKKARLIHPYNDWNDAPYSTWCNSPDQVKVTYIGKAAKKTKAGIILSSLNAG